MRDVETLLTKLSAKNRAFDALTKSFKLLKLDKVEDAKAVIDSAIKYNKENYTNSNILYRILSMVYELYESNYKFNDVIKYHAEYRSIIDLSVFGDRWVYGDDVYEIKEVSEAVVSLAEDVLPDDYNALITYISKFDTDSMNFLHRDVDFSLIEPVSKMMQAIERIDVYQINYLLLQCDKTPGSIYEACKKLEDSE
jgi:hypothetical protein